MKSIEKNGIIIFRLYPGENILQSLQELSEKHNLSTAIILSGVGQIKNPTLGYFKQKNDYTEQTFQGIYELLSLSGNIIYDGETYHIHAHTVIGDEQKQTKGGHLINGTVSITNEIALLKTEIEAIRTISKQTGLAELKL
ncbi:MAG: DUF296 domain-containing protein [Thermoplasmatota archaeon]